MKILTVQELANTAKDRWKRQYFYNGYWEHGNDKKTVYENLVALVRTQHLNKLMR